TPPTRPTAPTSSCTTTTSSGQLGRSDADTEAHDCRSARRIGREIGHHALVVLRLLVASESFVVVTEACRCLLELLEVAVQHSWSSDVHPSGMPSAIAGFSVVAESQCLPISTPLARASGVGGDLTLIAVNLEGRAVGRGDATQASVAVFERLD